MPIKVYLRDYLSAGHPDWPNLLTIDNIDLCGIDPLDMEIGYKFSVLYPLGEGNDIQFGQGCREFGVRRSMPRKVCRCLLNCA
jgi:hypothetical protein